MDNDNIHIGKALGISFIEIPPLRKCKFCEKEFPQHEDGFFTNEKKEEFHFDCYIRDIVKEQVKIELEKN